MIVNAAWSFSTTPSWPAASVPVRIFGPCRSCRIDTGLATRRDTRRMVAITAAWSAWVPCEKFKRATFMPAAIRAAILSSELLAGPMVQTILVRRKLASKFHLRLI